MTTEIAIANKEAIALAADSAVTISMPDGQKIYNSANKLFELSLHHPVGIMIYGNAQLTGVPWETLIKEYRRKLGNKCFPQLLDYCNDFLQFLYEHKNYFPETEQGAYVQFLVEKLFEEIRDEIHKEIASLFEQQEKVSRAETNQVIEKAIEKQYQYFATLKILPCFSESFITHFKKENQDKFNQLMKEVFDELYLDKKNRNKLFTTAVNLFIKDYFTFLESGIAIAGFGDEEIFPKLYTYRFEAVVAGQLKYVLYDEKCILGDQYPAIVPFGQEDMICSFMEGIDRRLEILSLRTLDQILENFSEAIFDEVKTSLSVDSDKVDDLMNKSIVNKKHLLEKYSDAMQRVRDQLHVQPVLTTVSVLPKDELGAMAQSLVNLTALKRRVTTAPETVGGPTDVAVLSKGDGFIWIERKHYFRPELNQSFFQRKWHGGGVNFNKNAGEEHG